MAAAQLLIRSEFIQTSCAFRGRYELGSTQRLASMLLASASGPGTATSRLGCPDLKPGRAMVDPAVTLIEEGCTSSSAWNRTTSESRRARTSRATQHTWPRLDDQPQTDRLVDHHQVVKHDVEESLVGNGGITPWYRYSFSDFSSMTFSPG